MDNQKTYSASKYMRDMDAFTAGTICADQNKYVSACEEFGIKPNRYPVVCMSTYYARFYPTALFGKQMCAHSQEHTKPCEFRCIRCGAIRTEHDDDSHDCDYNDPCKTCGKDHTRLVIEAVHTCNKIKKIFDNGLGKYPFQWRLLADDPENFKRIMNVGIVIQDVINEYSIPAEMLQKEQLNSLRSDIKLMKKQETASIYEELALRSKVQSAESESMELRKEAEDLRSALSFAHKQIEELKTSRKKIADEQNTTIIQMEEIIMNLVEGKGGRDLPFNLRMILTGIKKRRSATSSATSSTTSSTSFWDRY